MILQKIVDRFKLEESHRFNPKKIGSIMLQQLYLNKFIIAWDLCDLKLDYLNKDVRFKNKGEMMNLTDEERWSLIWYTLIEDEKLCDKVMTFVAESAGNRGNVSEGTNFNQTIYRTKKLFQIAYSHHYIYPDFTVNPAILQVALNSQVLHLNSKYSLLSLQEKINTLTAQNKKLEKENTDLKELVDKDK